ncbi:hypothetical protein GRF29_19g1719127 [Pseudopithomyces chartarum]|uniref:Uncharacterized protein n=1 Tax=Pseudopithomyces chartarum TaxID=1892770 RepID=A0AAN6M4V7_9PLEO|nr:hypothetical protein GRF29_19g1719127 [Pseudopithomyces chartarum]
MSRLNLYTAPPFNYLGTTLFLSYIVLALILTLSVTLSLRTQYNRIPSSKAPLDIKNARRRHIKIYAFLASLSFALLSTNMLGFLITSMTAWARARSLLGERVGVWSLGRWMLETQQHALSTRTMIPFIALSQILPITFTACLFTIQLHLSALGVSNSSPTPPPKPKTQPTVTPSKPSSNGIPLLLPTLALNALLISIPTLSSTLFIPALLLTRVILLLPHTGRLRARDQDVLQSVAVSLGIEFGTAKAHYGYH